MNNPLMIAKKTAKKLYNNALQSIAFYPVFISLSFAFFAVFILYIEELPFIIKLEKKLPYLFIQDIDTAKTLLSVFIAGIISLTVFSFSMVMGVLNQASANFSPRLLPGLVSNKRHQIILGFYIGTLLYCTLIFISLGTFGVEAKSMGLATSLAALAGVACVAVFVYFIHMISGAIQIHNIVTRVHHSTDTSLDKLVKNAADNVVGLQSFDSEGWVEVSVRKSGYFRGFDITLLGEVLNEDEHQILILPYVGQHIWEGDPIIKSNKPLKAEEIDELLFCISISPNRHTENDATGGLIQLMEIAVKALSPGINDPGTALGVISHLGGLLVKIFSLPHMTSELFRNDKLNIIKNHVPPEELLRKVIEPIRIYGKQDTAVVNDLTKTLKFIHSQHLSSTTKEALEKELDALQLDVKENISNPMDRERLLKLFQ